MSNESVVVKANDLIRAGYRLTLMEQRLILLAITKISRQEVDHIKFYRVTAQDMSKQLNVECSSLYPMLREAVENLFDRKFTIYLSDGKPITSRWVDGARYLDGEGAVELSFSQAILPFLTNLKECFTTYHYVEIAGLNNSYSVRIYELMMQWKRTGRAEIGVKELRHILELKDLYPKVFDLRRKVIEPSLAQINKCTPFKVSVKPKKSGRNITSFVFSFSRKEKAVTPVLKKVAKKKIGKSAKAKQSNQAQKMIADAKMFTGS